MSPLNELFVHGRHELAYWNRILVMYEEWFTHALEFGRLGTPKDDLNRIRQELVQHKTHTRLRAFGEKTGFDLNAKVTVNGKQLCSVSDLAEIAIDTAMVLDPIPALVHGDICFSNALYDSRNNRLRFLDPRGISSETNSAIGDLRYDIAKLAHSIAGHYDLLIAGNFSAVNEADYSFSFQVHTNNTQDTLAKQFYEGNLFYASQLKEAAKVSLADTVLLFLSMLPLHSDRPDRQLAFILNAYRLWFSID